MTQTLLVEPVQTPLIEKNSILIKHEGEQIASSVKYRMVYGKVKKALELSVVSPGVTLCEASAGSTGVALAEIGAQISTPVEIHMYEDSDKNKVEKIQSRGAKIVFYKKDFPFGKILQNIGEKNRDDGFWHLNQMDRASVTMAYEGLADELITQLADRVPERFVCPVGTGGVIQGVGRVLRQRYPNIEIIALEPQKGQVIDGLRNTDEMYLGEQDPYDRNFPEVRVEVSAVEKKRKIQGFLLGDSATASFILATERGWESVLMIAAD